MTAHFNSLIAKTKKKNKSIISKLAQRMATIGLATDDALLMVSLNILEKSLYYCPIETGQLRASGFLKSTKRESRATGGAIGSISVPTSITYTIGYSPNSLTGNFIIPPKARAFYAWYVHEILDNKHKTPTQAKFLEQALNDHKNDIAKAIIKEVRGRPFARPTKQVTPSIRIFTQ